MNTLLQTSPLGHAKRSATGAGILAGIMGGLAEVAWITLYQQAGGVDASVVARGVTDSLAPSLAGGTWAVVLGLTIHMTIAAALGVAIAVFLRKALPRLAGTALEPVAVVALLVGVWAVNFFVVLPVVNPAFVTVVPFGVSLMSKVLFGLAAAFVLARANKPR